MENNNKFSELSLETHLYVTKVVELTLEHLKYIILILWIILCQ